MWVESWPRSQVMRKWNRITTRELFWADSQENLPACLIDYVEYSLDDAYNWVEAKHTDLSEWTGANVFTPTVPLLVVWERTTSQIWLFATADKQFLRPSRISMS